MQSASLKKFVATSAGVILPALPFIACIGFRGIEAWKLWHEMSRFSALGMLAWLWAAAFLGAATVGLFQLGTRRVLRQWEFLVDAANAVTAALLALQCADQQVTFLHAVSYGWRVGLWFAVILIPQFTVTFAAREARAVARRLQLISRSSPARGEFQIVLVMEHNPRRPAELLPDRKLDNRQPPSRRMESDR